MRLNAQSVRRKIRLHYTTDPALVAHLKPALNCTKRWYGNSYGGFYVNPDLLKPGAVVYSIGIGKDISFDRALLRRHACQVYGFDPTPKSIAFIAEQKNLRGFHFYPYGIAPETKTETFFLPRNPRGVSGSLALNETVDASNSIQVPLKSLQDITRELGHTHIDVLKMDIEGAEYEVIEAVLESGIPIGQLLVEFHDRFFEGPWRSQGSVELLAKNGYELFGTSLSFEEVSFVHRKHAGL